MSKVGSILDGLSFDNRFVRELPGDPVSETRRRQVFAACYSRVKPTPVAQPKLLAWSREMASELGIEGNPFEDPLVAKVLGGNHLLEGMDPFAMCYGGHQFGHWAGQLGDGRAINLGEVVTNRGGRWMLQLKGAGPTPYSRTADGLAVLRSSLREFVCSEAMYHLGVPTTRALSLVGTGEPVVRDMFYDGNPKAEPGAIVCRVAPTFTRFGNFQIFAARDDETNLRKLIDYTLRNDFPHLGPLGPESIAAWFKEVCQRTATMIVHWMRVGFVHGVMNTDNMSILGLTIDFGPYGWLEDYDPFWTPNTTDAQGRRYRFGQQPQIALWNLAQLGNCLVGLVGNVEPLQESLIAYQEAYETQWDATMASKLGWDHHGGDADTKLIQELFSLMRDSKADMTLFFRRLARWVPGSGEEVPDLFATPMRESLYEPDALGETLKKRWSDWLLAYGDRLKQNRITPEDRVNLMNRVNPLYVFRNYLAQQAIDAAEQGNSQPIEDLLEVLRHPYTEQPGKESYSEKRPEWARYKAGCSMLSCSS